ncbi:MAG: hypothetical protein U5L00_07850 [Desulfovermiculus sp.]|nr:hypothetical protein [Desulfovermiculus sp.]
MSSRSFYQNQAQAYFEQTFGVDPSSFLLPLVRRLFLVHVFWTLAAGAGRGYALADE